MVKQQKTDQLNRWPSLWGSASQPARARKKGNTVQNLHLLACESRAREKCVSDEKHENS